MIRALALLLGVMCIATADAQGFVADGDDFTLSVGDMTYTYSPPGKWQASVEDGPSLHWQNVLWHSNWVYEYLHQAELSRGPVLTDEGAVELEGTFVKAEGAAPIEFRMTARPTDDGVSVDFAVRKTGELRLRRGVLISASLMRDVFDGDEPVYLPPVTHASLGSCPSETCRGFGVALSGDRGLRLSPADWGLVSGHASEKRFEYRLGLTPADFPVGEWQCADWSVALEPLPAPMPGEIPPGRDPLAINGVTVSRETVPLDMHTELTVDLSATWDNPFDPDDVALDAEFTGPSGRSLAVPGFFMTDVEREIVDGTEVMSLVGEGRWCVRFSPTEEGRWTCRLTLRDRTGEVSADGGDLTATPREGHGFVRVSPADPRGFAFDDGEGYFPVGHNLPIYHERGQLGTQGMERFAAAGENYNRWWMCSYGFGIETVELGRYRQPAAARIDLVLEQARELGMYYMMCMDTHQDFRRDGWTRNPFNAARGGPCATPNDWFTSEEARDYYRKRLRYTVARWGYSPHVLCWEFGNEMQGWAGAKADDQLAWHAEMSDYLASIDPFDHLITTSFWGGHGDARFWDLPNIDIVQSHHYGSKGRGIVPEVVRFSREVRERWDKPHIFAEFGISSRGHDGDPEGWALHNAIWAGTMSGCAGSPMPWWHENYIDPLDLYFHFTSIANFTRDLPLGTERWEPLEVSAEYQDPDTRPAVDDLVIQPVIRWGLPPQSEFLVNADGSIADGIAPQALLQGRGHKDIRNPPTFVVKYPQAGRFIAHVGDVSSGGDLRIFVDDEEVLRRELPTGEGLGVKSVWREQWKLWETTYDEDIAVDVAAGEHRIRVENDGRDWIKVSRYTFTGCVLFPRPRFLACGIGTSTVMALWLQNPASDWVAHGAGEAIEPVPAMLVTVAGVPDGRYRIERWETWLGTVANTDEVEARDGVLRIAVEPLASDLALKIRPAP